MAATSASRTTSPVSPAVVPPVAPAPIRLKAGASVPRAIRAQAQLILAETFDYIDSPAYANKAIERQLIADGDPELPLTAWYQPTRDEAPTNAGSPQLMSAREEREMFLRFNYSKVRLNVIKRRVQREGLDRKSADEAIDWHKRMEHYREYLVRTNLALVLAMAKRSRLGDVDFAEVVSEGNMALLRAVEKFNVDRGFKFSTYACRAILKAFSRAAQKSSRHRTRFPVEFEPELEKSDWADKRRDQVQDDCIDELKQIVDRNLAELSDIEETVIKRRFNWEQAEENPLTLEEVGRIIGVTKERVRQIQNKALLKIKQVMEDGILRVVPRSAEESQQGSNPGGDQAV